MIDLQSAYSNPTTRHALVLIGLPGDQERRLRFDGVSETILRWLRDALGVDSSNVTVLSATAESEDQKSTAENIRSVAKELTAKLGKDDSLWVFLIGHGSEDERRAWFHLPGPDMHATDWAGLFSELNAGEQVFWLTHSASGSFVKPFSLANRVVIAATDAGEVNETLFPAVLSDTLTQLHEANETAAPTESPQNGAQSLTLLDLFNMTAEKVHQRYEKNKLLPTEHSRLDDNGDGIGSELGDLAGIGSSARDAEAAKATIDGFVAARIRIQGSHLEKSEGNPRKSLDTVYE